LLGLRIVASGHVAQRVERAVTRVCQRHGGIGSEREPFHPAVPLIDNGPRFHTGRRDAEREVWLVLIEKLEAPRSGLKRLYFSCVEMYPCHEFPFRLLFYSAIRKP